MVKAEVRLKGSKQSHSSTALVDTEARMTLIDKALADHLGVEYTGRSLDFISISGHVVKSMEAVISELELEGELLKYEALAVANIPRRVKEALSKVGVDENIVIGLLTLERANLIPDTTTGALRKTESFILQLRQS